MKSTLMKLLFGIAIILNWSVFTYMLITGDKNIFLFLGCVIVTGGVFLAQEFIGGDEDG
jgi:hypothetical protein